MSFSITRMSISSLIYDSLYVVLFCLRLYLQAPSASSAASVGRLLFSSQPSSSDCTRDITLLKQLCQQPAKPQATVRRHAHTHIQIKYGCRGGRLKGPLEGPFEAVMEGDKCQTPRCTALEPCQLFTASWCGCLLLSDTVKMKYLTLSLSLDWSNSSQQSCFCWLTGPASKTGPRGQNSTAVIL